MRAPVVVGSYVPGDTVVHRLDPRVKLVVTVVFLIVVFMARSWAGLLICGGAVIVLARVAKVPKGWVARSLAPLVPLLVITWVLNIVVPPGLDRAGFALGPVTLLVPAEQIPPRIIGLAWGAFIGVRIATMVGGAALLALTTSPRALADAMAFYGRPLALLRVPVDDIAMMMTIALRFMPTLAEELAQLVRARMARGADFGGSLPSRARVWTSVMVPLFVGLFRRADELSTAMEARGYHSGPRPRLHPLKTAPRDAVALLVAAAWLLVALSAPGGW